MYSIVFHFRFRKKSRFHILCNRGNDVPRFGNTDFPQFVGEWYFLRHLQRLRIIQIRNRLWIWLSQHGLIYNSILLYHRGQPLTHFCGKLVPLQVLSLNQYYRWCPFGLIVENSNSTSVSLCKISLLPKTDKQTF